MVWRTLLYSVVGFVGEAGAERQARFPRGRDRLFGNLLLGRQDVLVLAADRANQPRLAPADGPGRR